MPRRGRPPNRRRRDPTITWRDGSYLQFQDTPVHHLQHDDPAPDEFGHLFGLYRKLISVRGTGLGMDSVERAAARIYRALSYANLDPHRPARWEYYAAPIVPQKAIQSSNRRSSILRDIPTAELEARLLGWLPASAHSPLTLAYKGITRIGVGFRGSQSGIGFLLESPELTAERAAGSEELATASGVQTLECGQPHETNIPIFLAKKTPKDELFDRISVAVGGIMSGDDIEITLDRVAVAKSIYMH